MINYYDDIKNGSVKYLCVEGNNKKYFFRYIDSCKYNCYKPLCGKPFKKGSEIMWCPQKRGKTQRVVGGFKIEYVDEYMERLKKLGIVCYLVFNKD